MKKYLCFMLVLSLFSSLFAQHNLPVLQNFTAGGNDIVSTSLEKFPLSIASHGNDGVSLTAELHLPDGWKGPVGIILYKNLMSINVYVNDVLIDTVGRSGENFFFQPYITRGVLIPESVLKPENTVRLELWNDTGTYKIRMLSVVDAKTYQNNMRLYSFLDIQLPRFACVLLMFVALYSLFMFVNYHEKKEFCYLAFAACFFSFYLLNVTVWDSSMSYLLLKALLYSCFPISIFFIILFFGRFLGIRMSRKFIYSVLAAGGIFIGGYYLQKNTAALDGWHSIMLVYPFFALTFGAVGFFKSLKKTGIQNLAIGLGLGAAVVCSAYDMYNFVFDITPFILLQGIGFMALIIGIFFSISQEIAYTNRKCVKFADELKSNRDRREVMFDHIRTASGKATESGTIVDSSIAAVDTLVSQYLVSSNQVNSSIGIQHEQVQSNKNTVGKIFNSIDKMSEMVKHHEKLVNETVTDVGSITEGIHTTDELVKKTSNTIKDLTAVCTTASNDVSASLRMVDDLANFSKNIYAIVNSISELSQQTNVLSINAAIEAARSGQEGKGFSVVASEIRSLASQSGENAEKINKILSTMVEKIGNIQSQEELVSARLKDVIAENVKTDVGITEIFNELNRQLDQSNRISSIISELMQTIRTISEQTAEQRTNGEALNESLTLLTKITEDVYAASKEQMRCNEELKDNLRTMQTASQNNVGVITELQSLVETK